MPSQNSEYEFSSATDFNAAVQTVIDNDSRIALVNNATAGNIADTLVKRDEEGGAKLTTTNSDHFQLAGVVFAGDELTPVAHVESNDPEDLQDKINELVDVVNLQRTAH